MMKNSYIIYFISTSFVTFSLQNGNCVHAASQQILLVGDSMASFMGHTLESFCQSAKVSNAGIGGTTAENWASFTANDIEQCQNNDWDSVYISVGGNDFLGSGCTMSTSELKSRMEGAIQNIVDNIAPGASTYLLTGYCMPFSSEEEGSEQCGSPSDFMPLSEVTSMVSVAMPAGSTLEVVNSVDICRGTSTSFSDEMFFQDPIHLNAKGYCKVFTQKSVQSALNCGSLPPEYYYNDHCDELELKIYGLNENCGNDDEESSAYSYSNQVLPIFNIFALLCLNLYMYNVL